VIGTKYEPQISNLFQTSSVTCVINQFKVLGLITYMNEIPIILVGYQNLRIQYLAHKGLIGYLDVTYHAGKFLT
jgi:hypothetical protein